MCICSAFNRNTHTHFSSTGKGTASCDGNFGGVIGLYASMIPFSVEPDNRPEVAASLTAGHWNVPCLTPFPRERAVRAAFTRLYATCVTFVRGELVATGPGLLHDPHKKHQVTRVILHDTGLHISTSLTYTCKHFVDITHSIAAAANLYQWQQAAVQWCHQAAYQLPCTCP